MIPSSFFPFPWETRGKPGTDKQEALPSENSSLSLPSPRRREARDRCSRELWNSTGADVEANKSFVPIGREQAWEIRRVTLPPLTDVRSGSYMSPTFAVTPATVGKRHGGPPPEVLVPPARGSAHLWVSVSSARRCRRVQLTLVAVAGDGLSCSRTSRSRMALPRAPLCARVWAECARSRSSGGSMMEWFG